MVELAIISILLLILFGMAFSLLKNFSAAKTSLMVQNSFYSLCKIITENMKQDLYSANKISISSNDIKVNRFIDISANGDLTQNNVAYHFNPPIIEIMRNDIGRKIDFSEVTSAVGGKLHFSLSGKLTRDDPNEQEAVIDIKIHMISKDCKQIEGLAYNVALIARAREGLFIDSSGTSQ